MPLAEQHTHTSPSDGGSGGGNECEIKPEYIKKRQKEGGEYKWFPCRRLSPAETWEWLRRITRATTLAQVMQLEQKRTSFSWLWKSGVVISILLAF